MNVHAVSIGELIVKIARMRKYAMKEKMKRIRTAEDMEMKKTRMAESYLVKPEWEKKRKKIS